jgi:hypothetical protein
LRPGGGELARHTDQVDPDAGIKPGKLMRMHVPLETNDHVKFSSWTPGGQGLDVHMDVGNSYFLDTRKPHKAVNDGTTIRTHLVIDVVANAKFIAQMEAKYSLWSL